MRTSDIRYIIDEDKRTVVAILEGCSEDAYSEITLRGHYGNRSSTVAYPRYSNVEMPDIIRGVAKCHPEDTFDVEEGKRVARRKLRRTYNKFKVGIIKKHIADLQTLEDRLISRVSAIYKEELIEE